LEYSLLHFQEEYKEMLKSRTSDEKQNAANPTMAVVAPEEVGNEVFSKKMSDLEEQVKKIKEENKSLEAALNVATKEVLDLSKDKQFIRNLLELKEPELKALCQAKKIGLSGQRKDKRNNYIVKLLEHLEE
jgi:hypothetical protein